MVDNIVQNLEVAGVDKATSDIESFGDKGAAAINKVGDAAEKATPKLDALGEKAKEAADKVDFENVNKESAKLLVAAAKGEEAGKLFGTSLNNMGRSALATGRSIANLGIAAGKVIGSVIGLAKGIGVLSRGQDGSSAANKQMNAELRDTSSETIAAASRSITLARSISDLNKEYAAGKIGAGEYSKKLLELQTKSREQAEDAKKLDAIQRQVTEQRLKDAAAAQKQIQAQETQTKLTAVFGSDLLASLLKLDKASTDFWQRFLQGPSAAARAVDALTQFIEQNGDKILEFYNRIADSIGSIFSGNGDAVKSFGETFTGIGETITTIITGVVVPAIKGIVSILDIAANSLNALFGTKFTGMGLAAVLILGKITGATTTLYAAFGVLTTAVNVLRFAFGPWGIVIGLVITALIFLATKIDWNAVSEKAVAAIKFITDAWAGIEKFFSDIWTAIKQLTSDAWDGIKGIFESTVQFFTDLWTAIKDKTVEIWEGIKESFVTAWDNIKQVFSDFVEWFMSNTFLGRILGAIGQIVDKLKEWWQGAKDVAAAQAEANQDAGNADGAVGLAGGGHVRGPGGETGDKIPAWLSNNEWVIRAKAVRKYGHAFMQAINDGRFDLGKLAGRFARGGPVRMPSFGPQRFASGGPVLGHSSGRPFNLIIGSEVFSDLIAPEQTADRLVRFAVTKSSRSAGKRPGWVGGQS